MCAKQFFGHIICDIACRAAFTLGPAEYFQRDFVNARCMCHRPIALIAGFSFVKEIDDATCIDDIVRRVKNFARSQFGAILGAL